LVFIFAKIRKHPLQPAPDRPGVLQANLATTALVFMFMMNIVEISRTSEKASLAKSWIRNLGQLVCKTVLDSGIETSIQVWRNMCLVLTPPGMINGLDYVISSAHRTVALSLKDEWQNMARANLLFTQWDAPSFIDVLMFACSLEKFRKESNKKPLKSGIIKNLKVALVSFMSNMLHSYIWNIYARSHDIYNGEIPSRRKFLRKRQGSDPVHVYFLFDFIQITWLLVVGSCTLSFLPGNFLMTHLMNLILVMAPQVRILRQNLH
jgi:hypothetical protein